MIRFRCPSCDALVDAPADAAGTSRPCAACGTRCRVPGRPVAAGPVATGLVLEAGDPRPHHYTFAHQFLPAMARSDPAAALALVIDPEDTIVRDCWAWVGSKLDPGDRLEPAGLATSFDDRGGWRLGLVTLPPARRMPEAIYVGLAFDPSRPGSVRVVTLELSQDFAAGAASTILAEWTGEAESLSHLNLGPGPAAEPGAFLDAVARVAGIE